MKTYQGHTAGGWTRRGTVARIDGRYQAAVRISGKDGGRFVSLTGDEGMLQIGGLASLPMSPRAKAELRTLETRAKATGGYTMAEAHWDRRAGVYRHNGAVSADGDWWHWGTVGGRPATIPGALRLSGGPRNGVVVA